MSSVLVTIPSFNTPPELLERAIISVLDQTYDNMALVVINDGGIAPLDVAHLKRRRAFTVERHGTNRGRYAADHAALQQDGRWWDYWFPLDSDDWVEPGFLEWMVQLAEDQHADVAFCSQEVHGRRNHLIEQVKAWDGTDDLRWHAHLSNLWSIKYVMENNLTNPSMRVAWDTVMTSVPFLNGRVAICDGPHRVHRVVRDGSLTSSRETGFRSRLRMRTRIHCEHVWRRCVADRNNIPAIMSEARRWTP